MMLKLKMQIIETYNVESRENSMNFVLGMIGVAAILGLSLLLSNNRKDINYKSIGLMIVSQLIITLFMFKTTVGKAIVDYVTLVFDKLIGFGLAGVQFVFGGLTESDSVFFFNVLLIIIFFSAVIGVLNYIKVLPFIIRIVGAVVSKITMMPKLESFNASAAMVFGQSEVFLAIKDQLPGLSRQRLYTISASAMGSVSASIMGAYLTMLPPQYVLAAIPLNMFSALIIASILMPVKVPKEEDVIHIHVEEEKTSFFEMLSNAILDGAKIAIIVGAMLVGYIALMEFVNYIVMAFGELFGLTITLQEILGFVFAPFALLLGIPMSEVIDAGGIMATKVVLNEFVAMTQFQPMIENFSERTVAVVSTFLISFANFSSIGIIAGSVKALNDKQSKIIASFGLKLLLGATLASLLSAAIVGFFV